jgi:hypothetical protein
MAVTRKRNLTPRQRAANRGNALRSTGPRTRQGKRHSRMNALRHGLCTKAFRDVMIDLNEDPKEFDLLHQGLIDSLEPRNTLEFTLVEDLAKLWWKKARAERAQAGVQVREVEQMQTARLKEIYEVNRDALDETDDEIMEKGVLRARDCTGKFEDALRLVEILRAHVEGRNYCDNLEGMLQALYGKKPTWRGSMVITAFNALQQAEAEAEENSEPQDTGPQGSDPAEIASGANDPLDTPAASEDGTSRLESARSSVSLLLQEELRDLYGQHEVFLRQHVEMSDAVRDSYLAPTDSRWTWMLRMDNFLERQIDRKLKLFMQLRRYQNSNEAAAPPTPRGGNGRRTLKTSRDVKMQKRSHHVVENKGSHLASFSKTDPERTHFRAERSQSQGQVACGKWHVERNHRDAGNGREVTGDGLQGAGLPGLPTEHCRLEGAQIRNPLFDFRTASFGFAIAAFADIAPRFQKLDCKTAFGGVNSQANF